MSINETLNYLLAKRSEVVLCFSGTVVNITIDLKGAGGESGSGFPLPRAARLLRVDCWDGTSLVSDTGNESASQGDLVSVKAVANGAVFDVTVQLNGADTNLVAAGADQNTSLMVTVYLVFTD